MTLAIQQTGGVSSSGPMGPGQLIDLDLPDFSTTNIVHDVSDAEIAQTVQNLEDPTDHPAGSSLDSQQDSSPTASDSGVARNLSEATASLKANQTITLGETQFLSVETGKSYRVEKFLGQGTMGVAYLASYIDKESVDGVETPVGKTAVIKILKSQDDPNLPADKQSIDITQLKRSEREMKAMRKVASGAHVAQILDSNWDPVNPNNCFLVITYYPNGNLADRIAMDNSLTQDKLVRTLLKTLEGLAYLHSHNIIHRDFKLANIFLDENLEPKVADFGLAKEGFDPTMTAQATNVTATGSAVGTPYCMAPEQTLGNKKRVTEAADIYSWAANMYFVLSGKYPFPASSSLAMMNKIADCENNAPIDITTFNKSVPKELNDLLINILTTKDPNERVQAFRRGTKPVALTLAERVVAILDAADMKHGLGWKMLATKRSPIYVEAEAKRAAAANVAVPSASHIVGSAA